MRDQWTLLLVAVQALTRLPVHPAFAPDSLRRAVRFFPAVGAALGGVAAGVFAAASAGLPPFVAACLSLAATLLLTGALHEDGLADCCDGFGGGRATADALRIMRDSRIGAFGTVGLVVVIGAKLGCLATIDGAGWALVAAHAASRGWTVVTARFLPYARPEGMAAGVAASDWADVAIACACAGLAILLLGPQSGAALGLSGLVALGLGLYARRRLGGYTGDVLGAVQQLTELAVLLAAAWRAA